MKQYWAMLLGSGLCGMTALLMLCDGRIVDGSVQSALCMLILNLRSAWMDADRTLSETNARDHRLWLIWNTGNRMWRLRDLGGYTSVRAQAGRYTFADALRQIRNVNCGEHPDQPIETIIYSDEEQ